jgi:hypothetical protein
MQRGRRAHRREGACVTCAWTDCHRQRSTRKPRVHHDRHHTMHQKTRESPTASPPQSAGAPRTDGRRAQQAAKVVEQALHDLGLPENLVAEIESRLRSQQRLLGEIVGVMGPPLFGCRTNSELCRVRGRDKNLPSHLLSALPKRSWLRWLRHLGLEVLVPLWRYAASASEATRSRWQWTWVGDDSVFKEYGDRLGLVGTW